ncbi:hypothetical protein [Pseudomonas aeruginosa]|uniref:hypothetical protein n=1 Tax=Pseudomonas aeruginosa TaxID=287 RepID=UPI00406D39BB
MFEDEETLRKEAEAAQARLRAEEYRFLMSDVRGRRFIWKLLVETRYETNTPLLDTHGGRQSYLLGSYDLGRAIGRNIRSQCPEQYLLMVRENSKQPDEVNQ